MDQIRESDLVIEILNEENSAVFANTSLTDLKFRLISEPDQWLATSYKMIATNFKANVLYPYERYVEWLDYNRKGQNRFPLLMIAAYFNVGNQVVIVGVLSGNIMQVVNYVPYEPLLTYPLFIFAIAHQVTSPFLRAQGVKGVGARLQERSIHESHQWINQRQGMCGYSLVEAEPGAIGFFSKQGYLWPKGVRYWQAPLEFDSQGNYVHTEVPELLMLKPHFIETIGLKASVIEKDLLKNIIATLYINWSLAKFRTSLVADAFQRAENYVMGDLLGRVYQAMPPDDPVLLVRVTNPAEIAAGW